ncbi:hypothetical protein SESBI_12291 [Sesbania bispinosa]|nr:hypothetical protein SESBI_12291 [Sesbania bispinosa]
MAHHINSRLIQKYSVEAVPIELHEKSKGISSGAIGPSPVPPILPLLLRTGHILL